MIEKIKTYVKEWLSSFLKDFGANYKTLYKCFLIAVILLYLGLFLWDWKDTGHPDLPELRSFAVILGAWAF